MNQDDLNEHFIAKHSNELCAIGEEEFEFIVENPVKRSNTEKMDEVAPSPTKKLKLSSKKQQQLEDAEEYIEYEEFIEDSPKMTKSKSSRTSARKPPKKETTKAQPLDEVPRVKLTMAEIEKLKKEGKILVRDGKFIMKT
jgi:hypothetical protein